MKKSFFKKRSLLLFLSVLLFLPNVFSYHLFKLQTEKYRWELFEPQLVNKIRSVDGLIAFADSAASVQGIEPNSLEYSVLLSTIIKRRFYHGYSHYALNENWMAAFAGKFIWSDLSAIVIPDDIMQYPMAACSQQSIILMKCFERKGIPFRKVGFEHHFTVEGSFNGRWYYFDPDMEPDFASVKRESLQSLVEKNEIFRLYKNTKDSAEIADGLANHYYGEVNSSPAPNATIFHEVTKFASKFLWFIPLSFFLIAIYKSYKMRQRRSFATSKNSGKGKKIEFIAGERV